MVLNLRNDRISLKLSVIPNNYLELPERSKMKIKTFLRMTSVEKTFFKDASPCHSIANQKFDNLFKNDK